MNIRARPVLARRGCISPADVSRTTRSPPSPALSLCPRRRSRRPRARAPPPSLSHPARLAVREERTGSTPRGPALVIKRARPKIILTAICGLFDGSECRAARCDGANKSSRFVRAAPSRPRRPFRIQARRRRSVRAVRRRGDGAQAISPVGSMRCTRPRAMCEVPRRRAPTSSCFSAGARGRRGAGEFSGAQEIVATPLANLASVWRGGRDDKRSTFCEKVCARWVWVVGAYHPHDVFSG